LRLPQKESVLVQELAGRIGLDVAAPELDAVAFEQAQLLLGVDESGLLDVAFGRSSRLSRVSRSSAATVGELPH